MTSEQIAKVCHEVNKAYCESLGDFSQKGWNELEYSEQQTQILAISIYFMASGVIPKELHNKWVESKIKDGWKYGEVKDIDKKTHPYLVEYDKIPQEERSKDFIYFQLVESLKDM